MPANQKHMGKFIKSIFKNESFSLTECTDGFWLYDYVLGMNVSMGTKTEQMAFIEALTYYQKKLKEVEKKYDGLNGKVETFFALFPKDDDED